MENYRLGYSDALASRRARVPQTDKAEYLAGYRDGTRELANEARIKREVRNDKPHNQVF
jgi:hypothetical protein